MSNQGKVCDAVLRVLEQRTGEARADVSHPEKNAIGPPVELRFTLGTQSYAIEHTQIEAFSHQIRTEEEFGQLILPVVNKISGTLPKPGVYYVYFPTDANVGVRANELPRIQASLADWIRKHAKLLHAEYPTMPTRDRNPRGVDKHVCERPPGFPYEVTLRRNVHWARSGRHDGVLLTARLAPEGLETRRANRLRVALDRKCPKLHRCKEEGARTILALEDTDMSLSNHVLIGDVIATILPERPDPPDEIYLVQASLDTWEVRLMNCDQRSLDGEDWIEFDSAELYDITA